MGRPKAWLPFGPETLLQRVLRQVGRDADPIVVVAAPGQELPPLPRGVTLARDPIPGRGPLQGLAAGFLALPDGVELVYATAVDAPFLASGWVDRLVSLIGPRDLAIPEVAGRLHPLAALYRREAALPAIEALLRADRLRLLDLVDRVDRRIVVGEELTDLDPAFRTLANLNTPEDYRQALNSESGPADR